MGILTTLSVYPSVEALSEIAPFTLSLCLRVHQCVRQRKSAEDVSPRAVHWPVQSHIERELRQLHSLQWNVFFLQQWRLVEPLKSSRK